MAAIRLDLDIDSDVHPELYAMLVSMGSAAARGERLRQLAATGLIWENCRAQGQYVEPSAPLPAPAHARGDGAAIAPATARKSSAAPPRGRKPPAAPPKSKDFIDLAIDAPDTVPQPLNDLLPSRQEIRDEIEKNGSDIPLLFDVVSPEETPRIIATVVHEPAPAPAGIRDGHKILQPVRPEAPVAEEEVHFREDAVPAAEEDTPAMGAPHKTGKRRRLLRMKEMGLFKNG